VDYAVILTEPARNDLREIVAFIAQDNPRAAVTFRDRLIAEAETLVRLPHRGRLMRRRGNVRKLVCRPYLILYRIAKSRRTVEILLSGTALEEPRVLG
jgi:toxin ParE1/3/4